MQDIKDLKEEVKYMAAAAVGMILKENIVCISNLTD